MAPRLNFSIQLPYKPDLQSWVDTIKKAEDTGFYSISVPDHLGPSLPQLAPLVCLGHAAAVTSRIRLAITVLDNDFRHPVMLAKEAATIDLLSQGRLDLGMGAGWLEEDYTKTGITSWDPNAVRVDRLFESIGLLRKLFTGEAVTHHGDHYTVTDFVSVPTPVQHPVPIMIGGKGKRMLTFGAKNAQIISLLPGQGFGPTGIAGLEEQLGWIRDAGGFDRKDLMVGLRIPYGEIPFPGETSTDAINRLADFLKITSDEVRSSPFIIAGDVSEIRDQLVHIYETYGLTYFTLSEDIAWKIAPIVEEFSGS